MKPDSRLGLVAILALMALGAFVFGAGMWVVTKSAVRPTPAQALSSAEHARPACPVCPTTVPTPTGSACTLFRSRKEAMEVFVRHGGDNSYVYVPASDPPLSCHTFPAGEKGRLYLDPEGQIECLPYYPKPGYP